MSFLIVNEATHGQLYRIELFSKEPIYDSFVGQVGFKHNHDRKEHAMLCQALKSQVSLKHLLSFLVITGEHQPNHEFLLKSQILQVSVQNPGKVVNRVALHG